MDGQGGDDAVFGRDGDDLIYGKAGNDRLYGERGIDYLSGGEGDDVLFGQEDRDRLWGDTGDDLVHGGTGNDELFGGDGNDNLKGNDGNDTLWGDYGFDRLDGGGGNDKLWVGAWGGRVLGGGGDDLIHAGQGTDTTTLIDGGAGRDTFDYSFSFPGGAIDDPYAEFMNVNDLITDFTRGQDKLDLSTFIVSEADGVLVDRDITFGDLDTSGDGIFDGNDATASITTASFWGVHKDSLKIDMGQVGNTGGVQGTITLYGVTELHPGDIVGLGEDLGAITGDAGKNRLHGTP
jgi:Ca2+-binding RTX toxin-like protein